ncbi:MAG: L,D-transpeptidase family protein [Coriobacteriaceae bacterium]|nr:L,D-transpeptidase family protein [Coriobacteriaceae bacterium]
MMHTYSLKKPLAFVLAAALAFTTLAGFSMQAQTAQAATTEDGTTTATEFTAPTIKKVTSPKYKRVKITWKQVSGADGYLLYRSTTETGGYKQLAEITNNATTSYKDKTATPGTTCYYRLKAYQGSGKKRTTTSYSAKLSISVPKNRWGWLQQHYQDDSSVKQLIFVKHKKGAKAKVLLYKKTKQGTWKKALSCAGAVGQNGIDKKKEGDWRTPTGTYNITGAFGLQKKPKTSLKYTKINKYLYACNDKKYYNQIIDIRKHPHSCTGEHLSLYPRSYAYGLFIDYNASHTYGKGSAIFMHCSGSTPYTSGCIAVSKSNMLKIMKKLQKGAKICIYPK